jgi:hypothetical protein
MLALIRRSLLQTASDLFVENGNQSLNYQRSTLDYSIQSYSNQAKDIGVIKM